MVSPSPDFQRRINNTDNIVIAQKAHFVPGLFGKYPGDYIDVDSLNNLKIKKPWIEPISEPSKSAVSNVQSLVVTEGDKILVICIDFSDRPHTISAATVHNRFFGTTGKTFRSFYSENSYGTYVPDGIVAGWYRAPQTYTYYRDDPSTTGCDYGIHGTYPHNVQKLFEDALDMISNDPNITDATLSELDIDRDGWLDRVFIVHAGSESAYGGSCSEIWAVTWGIYPKTVKSLTFSKFATSAEYLNVSSDPQRPGVDCHEYGHILGLPDLYDYSNNTNGVGTWSLMGSGSWGSDYAITPVHLDAWSKSRFGWVNIVTSPTGLTYIDDTETHNQIFKYQTSDSTEYFLVENRQNIGFDNNLPGNGLLIWHINEAVDQYSQPCHTVSLVQADGLQDLENKRNGWDSGDPYPGSANNRSFNISTTPSSLVCSGSLLDMSITNISNSSNRMSFNSTLSYPILTFVSPSTTSISTNATQQFTAIDQHNNPITTGGIAWARIGTGTINTTGLYSAGATAGITTISATYLGVTKTASVTVTLASPVLTTITISPPSGTSIYLGETQQYTASPKDQYGNPISATITWSSSDLSVATINSSGLATGTGVGICAIRAQSGSIFSSYSSLNVDLASPVTSTELTVDKNLCIDICTVNGTAAWINNGDNVGTLDPEILVNGVPIGLGSPIAINPGQTLSYMFSLPDLTVGTYSICTLPGTHCQTVVINTPPAIAEAGVGMFMMTGLVVGMLLMINKKI